MDEAKATEALTRFDGTIKAVVAQISQTFGFLAEADDVEQEARLLVLSYAGFSESPHGLGHFGRLADIERVTNGHTQRINRVLATMLRMDLNRYYGREAEKREPTLSIDAMPVNRHPSYQIEDTISSFVDIEMIRRAFPYLVARYVDGMTEKAIAEAVELSRSSVTRRVAKERDVMLVNYLTSRGLRLEGDETAEELLEAYGHLKAAGR